MKAPLKPFPECTGRRPVGPLARIALSASLVELYVGGRFILWNTNRPIALCLEEPQTSTANQTPPDRRARWMICHSQLFRSSRYILGPGALKNSSLSEGVSPRSPAPWTRRGRCTAPVSTRTATLQSPPGGMLGERRILYTNWKTDPPGEWTLLEDSAPRCRGEVQHLPSQHFKDEDAQRPPVHRSAVTFALDDLWGQVLGGATQGPGPDGTEREVDYV
ncbi:hypothetical protein EYF80_046103 [Liparis tanakae]|uniref:Uncharacterized protein n=1 Tax=Liparis tanakae TaxID=230148 RepID=A0A4Z2FRD5_9TELE|nr:hypothetical protein EYF80_046103 [Liparis tanakae]